MLGLGLGLSPSFAIPKMGISPLTLGADLWLRSDRGVTNGGSPVGDGGVVDAWNDPFNLLTVTQLTEAAKPTYQTNEFGALPALLFDGSDDFLHLGSALFTDYPFMIFVVGQPVDLTNSHVLFSVADDTSVDDRSWVAARGNVSGDPVGAGTSNGAGSTRYAAGSGPYSASAPNIFTGEFMSATDRKSWRNGGDLGIETTSRPITATYNVTDVGVLGDLTASSWFGGLIAEIVVFKRTLITAERLLMHEYLAIRYGITLL